jgi:hypothetical protein
MCENKTSGEILLSPNPHSDNRTAVKTPKFRRPAVLNNVRMKRKISREKIDAIYSSRMLQITINPKFVRSPSVHMLSSKML